MPRLRLPGLLLLMALATLVLLAGALYALRAEALRSGEQHVAAVAHVIAEQTARSLQTVDERLQLAAARLEALRTEGVLDEGTARIALRAQLANLPYVRAMWVLGGDGRITLDSDVGNIGVSLADREYFLYHQATPGSDFHVGPPVRSRSMNAWLVSASRPLRGPNGELQGVIVAAVEPPHFERLWRGLDLGDHGSIALLERNGRLVMRSPPDDAAMGRIFADQPLVTEYIPAAASGTFRSTSPVDGARRIFAWRSLPTLQDHFVLAGVSYNELLSPWTRFAMLSLAVWAAAVAAAALMARQLMRQRSAREAESQRFRQLAQAMPQIVFMCSARGAVTFINDRWAEATGVSVVAGLGTGWQTFVHPDDRATALVTLGKTFDAGREAQVEYRLLQADGAWHWQLLRAVPVHDEAGGLQMWYGTSTDIDDLKQAQERLAGQAELLKLASRLSRMGGWRADLATGEVLFSDEAAALLDLPPGRARLEAVFDMIVPRDRDKARRLVDECIVAGTSFDIEVELVTARGRRAWLRSIGQAVRGADGNVEALEGAQQDISDRVALLAEVRELNASLEEKVLLRTRELAQQEALFRSLAEQAPLPIWTVDNRGAVTFISRAFYDLVGGVPPQWHGHAWLDLMHPDDIEPMGRNWVEASREGRTHSGTRRIRALDGTYHTTSFIATPVRSAEGAIDFWVGVDMDITQLVAHEAELKLANEQLEAFSYSVSHDLQSPLQRIGSFAQLLQEELEGGQPGERAMHYAARIRANVDTMAELIEGLLSLSRVSSHDIVRGTVNLSEMAQEILAQLQAQDPDRSVRWEVVPGLAALADGRLMRSVLENLLGNAWKFTAVRADAHITVGGNMMRGEFFVRDNGAGFDMAYADKLFGTFQRLHTQNEFEGTGIGLATVARAISRQGGRIWAQAQPGQGATFWFTLPVAADTNSGYGPLSSRY